MALTGWKTNGGDKESGDRAEFLYLKKGNIYTVRLLKDPVRMAKYFYKNQGKMRVAVISADDRENCPVRAKHPEELKNPASLRYAVRVIDRKDGRIKVMEFPYSVYKQICEQSEHHNIDPGSKDGAEFTIKVATKTGFDMYTSIFDGASTLTNDEIALFQEYKDKTDLEKLYKIDSPEEVEQKLFGESYEKNIGSESESESESESDDNVDFSSDEDIEF